MLTQVDITHILTISREYNLLNQRVNEKALEIAKLLEPDTSFLEELSYNLENTFFECMRGTRRDSYAINGYHIPTYFLYETYERLKNHLVPSYLKEKARLEEIARLKRIQEEAEEELKRQEQAAKWRAEAERAKYLELKAKFEPSS